MNDKLLRFIKIIKEKSDAEKYNLQFDDFLDVYRFGQRELSFVLAFRHHEMFARSYELLTLDDEDVLYLYNKYAKNSLETEMNDRILAIKEEYKG